MFCLAQFKPFTAMLLCPTPQPQDSRRCGLLHAGEGHIPTAEHVSGRTHHGTQQGLAGHASCPSFSPSLHLATPPPPPSNTAGLCLFHHDSPVAPGKSNELETPVKGPKIQSLKVAQQPAQSQSLQLWGKAVSKDKPHVPQLIDSTGEEVRAEHRRKPQCGGPMPQPSLLQGG